MNTRDRARYASGSEQEAEYQRPQKRLRTSPSPDRPNGNGHTSMSLPPLSVSILGVETLDELISEVAEFVNNMIMNRATELKGQVEVEEKIGVLKDKGNGRRIEITVLVENSEWQH